MRRLLFSPGPKFLLKLSAKSDEPVMIYLQINGGNMKVSTTLSLDDAVVRAFKIYCAGRKVTMSHLVEQFMRRTIAERGSESEPRALTPETKSFYDVHQAACPYQIAINEIVHRILLNQNSVGEPKVNLGGLAENCKPS